MVLNHPEIPFHNNLSERDIREYVIKRKISSGTRLENGRRCRDTFLSLIKTCRKQSNSVWDFIRDRTSGENRPPYLPDFLSGKVRLLKV
ncbi:MAG: transposase [Gammaproteobacteria bacterium]|nr:transposase [Gammaproteobacteria bacterium]MBT3718230.1 transposase [Gammaproteobacteria bacterium]MBT3843979.1 transposase [Gammaproteobacteria bacterium]MBT3892145.1 transposase [Gammaproteobacteria bacterium]MBT4789481.1 transposase [Gammaproteobacteria bacterium]